MPDIRIILVRPKEPGNIGSAARAMKNFGLEELYLVAPQRALDENAYMMATHGADILERATRCDTVTQAIHDCQWVLGTTARARKAPTLDVHTPREAAANYPEGGLGILFGPEDFGLSNQDLEHCQGYIRIPTGEHASLNLAHAVLIVAYEWFIAIHKPKAKRSRQAAPRQMLEPMYDQLIDMLLLIGYTDHERRATANRMMRSIFDRAALDEREVSALRGLWSQVTWAALSDPNALPGHKRR